MILLSPPPLWPALLRGYDIVMKKKILLSLLVSLSVSYLLQAGDKEVNLMKIAERYSSDSLYRYIDNTLPSVSWVAGGSRWFVYTPKIEGKNKYYLVDTKSWKKKELFEENDLIAASDTFLDKDHQNNDCSRYRMMLEFDGKNMNSFRYNYCGNTLEYDIRKKIVRKASGADNNKSVKNRVNIDRSRKFSSDSLFWIAVKDDNLYLFADCGRDSIKLTDDGETYYSFAVGGGREYKRNRPQYPEGAWIGNTHRYIVVRCDKRKVGTLTLVNSLTEPRPNARTYKFPMPGDEYVPQYEVYIVDADRKVIERCLEMDKYPDQELIMKRFNSYSISGDYAYLLRTNRLRNVLDLCRIDGHNGSLKVLFSEDVAPHINEQMFSYNVLNEGKEILWWSERTGKGRYYLYDGEGKLKNAIGSTDCIAGNILRIDSVARRIYYEGYGGEKGINPNYRFYYSASLDGGAHRLLTPGNGNHSIEMSPDHKYIVDSYSRMDMAPKHRICDLKGNIMFEMQGADVEALNNIGWKYPEVLEVNAADSITKLYGVVYLPLNIESGKKYPIIADVYPGPQDDQIPQSFSLDDNYNQSLAQLGFVVINFQFRGSSPKRGRDFYTYGYHSLRDYPLEDLHAVIEQVASRYPFADIDKVGIYGHSGGGFMTVSAMLTRPDFYKVGIAASGNYDNNIYTQWWGETFHGGQWVKDKDGKEVFECRIPTDIELASNLRGRLFLITGDMDNNVHPANTIRLAKALIDTHKRFDMLVLPGIGHGVGDMYYINLVRYYFVEHLLGIKIQDNDIVKHL